MATAAWLLAIALCLPPAPALGQEPAADAAQPPFDPDPDDELRSFPLRRAERGVEYTGAGGRSAVNVWLRAQFRYSDPFDADPIEPEDYEDPPGGDLRVRRARVKAEAHIFDPKWGFYFEQGIAGGSRVLDLRSNIELSEHLRLRIGQYKVLYNRERVDSSGAQQFTERSIANRPFTLDRQRGVTVMGRVGAERAFDSWYYVGVFAGDGRDPRGGEGDDGDMWVARYQWNFTGEPLPFSQSDFAFRSVPSGTLSFGAAKFKGPYTRFSTGGGGQLEGFEPGTGDRYSVEQWMQEFAWQFNGFSVQQEYHEKRIDDTFTGNRVKLRGGYAQAGKAWHLSVGEWTRPIELALRLAKVDQNTYAPSDTQREATIALNLFFAGHDNKLTFDMSRLTLDQPSAPSLDDTRFRLQWDVSF